jgi:hypothetical protein
MRHNKTAMTISKSCEWALASARAMFTKFSNLHLNPKLCLALRSFDGIYLAKNLIIFASLSSNEVVGGKGIM